MNEDKDYSDDDVARRRDAAVRRALNTPPQPKAGKKSLTKNGAQTKPGGPTGEKDRPEGQ